MPKVNQRDPKYGDFDAIELDSADEDFEHEYDELAINPIPVTNIDDSELESAGQFDHLKSSIEAKPGQPINYTHANDSKYKDNFAALI